MPAVISLRLLMDYRLSPGSMAICSHEARDAGAPSLAGTGFQLTGSAAERLSRGRNPLEGSDFLSISLEVVGTPSGNLLA